VKANFTERAYEQFLNPMLWHEHISDPPSEFVEKRLGIDVMMLSFNQILWGFFGRQRTGVTVTRELWEGVKHNLDRIDVPYLFHANLFIQHKRPDYLRTKKGGEFVFWDSPYFRYDIDENQNDSLTVLENNLGNSGLVVYACPATAQVDELRQFAEQGSLVENSNFVNPSLLSGHSKYTFILGGTTGRAFSEPKEISSLNLNDEIKRLVKIPKRHKKNSDFIKELSMIIDKSADESNNIIKKRYHDIVRMYSKEWINDSEKAENDLGKNFVKIFSFLLVTDLTWKIV